jgi:hypothetical protein
MKNITLCTMTNHLIHDSPHIPVVQLEPLVPTDGQSTLLRHFPPRILRLREPKGDHFDVI